METTNALDFLGKTVTLEIDRPLGSKHPRHGFVYPLNYGFVPHTLSPDGAELDAYVLGVSVPLAEFTGSCIAVIHRTNDADDKLIVAAAGQSYTDDDIRRATWFQEQFFQAVILRRISLSASHGNEDSSLCRQESGSLAIWLWSGRAGLFAAGSRFGLPEPSASHGRPGRSPGRP